MNNREKAANLLEQLGELLPPPPKNDETREMLAAVLLKLDDVTARLAKIEGVSSGRRDSAQDDSIVRLHPSLQQFELPDIEQFLPGTNTKACAFEPNGKPCDECAMCSSRGF